MTESAKGKCPKCEGTGRTPYDGEPGLAYITYTYQKETNTVACKNCFGIGTVNLRPNGEPCLHEYVNISSAYDSMHGFNTYKCTHCNHSFEIDSSD